MDPISLQQYYTFILGVVFVYLMIRVLSFINKICKKNVVPEVTGGWPIVGHLNLTGGSLDPPHIALGSMAIKYGPIFTIQFGVRRILVINSWKFAKEIFTTYDAIVSSRPKYIAAKILGYDYVMFGITTYGPYWREMRKIASLELLSGRRLEQLKYIRVSELENSVRNLYEEWKERKDGTEKVLVDMNKWFAEFDMNVILQMIIGKRYSEATNGKEKDEMNRFVKSIREYFDLLGLLVVGDALPFLRWFDLGGHEKAMKRVVKEVDLMIGKWLYEHRKKKDHVGEKDFMDVMISAVEARGFADYDADTVIKATCLDIIASSADTLTATLTWALSLLMNNPRVLQKAQEEIDMHVGKDRQVDESDINKLVYLQAIVKEALRLYPTAPLAAPREFSTDCALSGYHIPKGTWLIVNISKIQRDPEIWSNPSDFRPERFLEGTCMEVDVKGRHFELIPFGAGRRHCPGMGLSHQILHIVLATLIHNFDMSMPDDEPVDMTESAGLINAKASPLEVQIVPRLPCII